MYRLHCVMNFDDRTYPVHKHHITGAFYFGPPQSLPSDLPLAEILQAVQEIGQTCGSSVISFTLTPTETPDAHSEWTVEEILQREG